VPQRFLDQYDPDTLTIPTFPPELEAQRAVSGPSDDELRAARHGYYAMISEVDDHIGHILACLDDQGQAENTIVVFISDHGDWLGARLRYGKGYPGDDNVSRVPLIVRWPAGIARPGRTVSDLVEALDVVPTLLDGAGIQLPPHLQGRSLVPVLQNRPSAARPSVLMEHTGWRNLRTADYRYIVERGGQETLYDLARDPQEYDNRAGDPAYAPALAHLRGLLLQHLLDAERPRPRVWPY
jgi:arylsulfatase A-like enzyme